MTFLEAVTRIMRNNAILRGDTDAPTSFSDTNHNASLQIAQLAIQDELTQLSANRLIPYERTSSTISLVTGQQTYALASDFVNFYGTPHFYDATDNRQIYEYPGGEESLQLSDFQYATNQGSPNWWYWYPTTTKKIGLYQVPNSTYSARSWAYEYEKSILVSNASDTMPFANSDESNMFALMAGRRFKFMFESVEKQADIQGILDNDRSYQNARATLLRLIRGENASKYYSPAYV